MREFVKRKVLGVGFSIASEREVLEYIVNNLTSKYFIVTPNPEILVMSAKDLEYRKVLNSARLSLPDGIGVLLASKLLGVSLKDKIAGVDLVESLCKMVAKRPITVSFLGGRPKIADKVAECLKKRFPSLKVEFTGSEIVSFKDLKGTDILFVAFGSPKQELWIAKSLSKLPVKVAIGVGGSFDMISGNLPRAPKWVRDLGLEWLFRLFQQPWRIKRQLRLIKFIYLVFKEKLG